MSTFSILDLIFQQKTPKKINLRNWFIFFVCVCACVPFCPFQLNWFFIYLIICFFFVSGFLNNSMNLWSNTKRNAHTYRLCMCVCLDFVFFFWKQNLTMQFYANCKPIPMKFNEPNCQICFSLWINMKTLKFFGKFSLPLLQRYDWKLSTRSHSLSIHHQNLPKRKMQKKKRKIAGLLNEKKRFRFCVGSFALRLDLTNQREKK